MTARKGSFFHKHKAEGGLEILWDFKISELPTHSDILLLAAYIK